MKNRSEVVNKARELYADESDGGIEIPLDSEVARADGGAWVSAWVWVPDDSFDEVNNA